MLDRQIAKIKFMTYISALMVSSYRECQGMNDKEAHQNDVPHMLYMYPSHTCANNVLICVHFVGWCYYSITPEYEGRKVTSLIIFGYEVWVWVPLILILFFSVTFTTMVYLRSKGKCMDPVCMQHLQN